MVIQVNWNLNQIFQSDKYHLCILEEGIGAGNLSDSALTTLKARFVAKGSRSRDDKLYGDFEIWNILRESDGFLCRNDGDCDWIYRSLQCREKDVSLSTLAEVRSQH